MLLLKSGHVMKALGIEPEALEIRIVNSPGEFEQPE